MSRREHGDPQIEELNVGEASEPEGRGTGECFHLSPQHQVTSICYSNVLPLGGTSAPLEMSSFMCFIEEIKTCST